jgi:hypothetical protein
VTTRREFLQGVGAIGLAALAPPPQVHEWEVTAEGGRLFAGGIPATGDGYYWCYMRPSVVKILRAEEARQEWRHAWRSYRIARRELVCGYLPPREVLVRFAEPMRGELGTFQGVRFIQGPA